VAPTVYSRQIDPSFELLVTRLLFLEGLNYQYKVGGSE